MYSYLKSYFVSSSGNDDVTNSRPKASALSNGQSATEKTSLLGGDEKNPNGTNAQNATQNHSQQKQPEKSGSNGEQGDNTSADVENANNDPVHPTPSKPPSAYELYFNDRNPTVQRYYRFNATPITPIVALHKKPGSSMGRQSNAAMVTSGVTGLLRRSAVVPSHGTDVSGDWLLVSVGGRSGWARKKSPRQHFSGFTLAERFAATEAWMGNHAFACGGKIMLGSDAPSLVFTNLLIVLGYVFHFCFVIPELRRIE